MLQHACSYLSSELQDQKGKPFTVTLAMAWVIATAVAMAVTEIWSRNCLSSCVDDGMWACGSPVLVPFTIGLAERTATAAIELPIA